jgi:aspartate/glutamate racemase
MRIALIHALLHSIEPINTALQRDWPAVTRMNLLDESLSADLARNVDRGGVGLDAAMHERFQQLAQYAVGTGANGILFTCSAFGSCIEAVARRHASIPVAKPNEAMVAEAAAHVDAHGGRLGLLSTFGPTLQSMPAEFPAHIPLVTGLADGALDALNRGDVVAHDALVAAAAKRLHGQGCTVIALAQFSLARSRAACEAATGLPVLTTVDSALRDMRARMSRLG